MDGAENTGSDGYLNSQLEELRTAIGNLDDDHIIRVIDHVRVEAGPAAARHLVAELLRAARNGITDPLSAACITTALARYGPDSQNR